MTRWLVQIDGEAFDTDEFPRWFPDGDAFGIKENETVYLAGPTFEKLSEPNQVYEAACQILDEFSTIITLLQS